MFKFPSPPKANDLSIAQQWFKLIDIVKVVYDLYAPASFTETFADSGPLAQDVDLVRDGKLPFQVRVAIGGTLSVVYIDDSTDDHIPGRGRG